MPDNLVLLEDHATEVMSYWGVKAGEWRVVGFLMGGMGAVPRPIIEVTGERYVLRRQAPDLTENDTRYRHAFLRHLATAGLPVPPLLQRPEGPTYAVVEDGIYELQGWRGGERLVSDGSLAEERLTAAAATLGRLHQASADFQWQPHLWPEERASAAIAQAYCRLIRERAEDESLALGLRAGLSRVAEACEARLDDAVAALDSAPLPPELHVHGDYHAYNVAFEGTEVSAVYDFDASHWQRRIDELAYALLFFTGVQWADTGGATPGITPPSAPDGLDVANVQRFLSAYGREAPPAEGEARLLGDALTLAFPAIFANGIAEDLIFPDDFSEPPNEADALSRLHWADTFWPWLDRTRAAMAQSWEQA